MESSSPSLCWLNAGPLPWSIRHWSEDMCVEWKVLDTKFYLKLTWKPITSSNFRHPIFKPWLTSWSTEGTMHDIATVTIKYPISYQLIDEGWQLQIYTLFHKNLHSPNSETRANGPESIPGPSHLKALSRGHNYPIRGPLHAYLIPKLYWGTVLWASIWDWTHTHTPMYSILCDK